MRKAIYWIGALAAAWVAWVLVTPPRDGFSDSDIARVKGLIRSGYMTKGEDVEVLDVQLSKISPKELTGYVRFRFGLLPASNHACMAIMDQTGANTSWKFAPERP